jgi:hypothetical protein
MRALADHVTRARTLYALFVGTLIGEPAPFPPSPRGERALAGLGMRGAPAHQRTALGRICAALLALTLPDLASCHVNLLRRAPRKCSAVHNRAGRPDRASTQPEEPVLPLLASPAPNARIVCDDEMLSTLRGATVRA